MASMAGVEPSDVTGVWLEVPAVSDFSPAISRAPDRASAGARVPLAMGPPYIVRRLTAYRGARTERRVKERERQRGRSRGSLTTSYDDTRSRSTPKGSRRRQDGSY